MTTPSPLKIALKSTEPIVKKYIANLEARQANLEAQNMGYKSKILALQKELKKFQIKHSGDLTLDMVLSAMDEKDKAKKRQ